MYQQRSLDIKNVRPVHRQLVSGFAALALAGVMSSAVGAQNYSEPPRGSAEREDLLDAMRPLAEWAFDPPLEFVVRDLRVAGDTAFINVTAQRPGGAPINPATSPVVVRDGESPELVDGPHLQALLRKSGRMWVSVQHSVGATDAWYCADVFYTIWEPVLPEICAR